MAGIYPFMGPASSISSQPERVRMDRRPNKETNGAREGRTSSTIRITTVILGRTIVSQRRRSLYRTSLAFLHTLFSAKCVHPFSVSAFFSPSTASFVAVDHLTLTSKQESRPSYSNCCVGLNTGHTCITNSSSPTIHQVPSFATSKRYMSFADMASSTAGAQ